MIKLNIVAMNIPKAFFIISITCILFLSSFFIASQIYHDNIPIDIQRDYNQISKNIQSTNENVSIIELSNKIILTSDSKEPTNIKILNPKYKSYQINHYDDNGNLISSKIVNSTEIQCLSITEWSTYEILGIDNISYGDGWIHYTYSDGTQAHKLTPTNYLRWDGEWRPKIELNLLSSDWPYLVEEFETYYLITRFDDSLTLSKTYRTYDFQPYKIGVELTLTPVQLNGMSTHHNIGGTDYWYITIPQSLKQTSKHLNWDNKLPTISNETGFVLNQSENVSGEWLPNYKYQNVGGELRLYYNQVARSFGIASIKITFDFNSYIINSSTGWANTSYSNFAYDRNTGYLILPDNVTDGLVLYHRMSGSSGIISYDMNLTLDNNGTLTNMNTGLDNGSSGWNSSGKYGNAISFDGTNDYINVSALILTPTNFSVSWWMYPTSLSDYNQWIGAENGWGSFAFHTTANGGVYVGTDTTYRFTPTQLPAGTVELNKWQHFVFTLEYVIGNMNGSFYKNGTLLSTPKGMFTSTAWGGFTIGKNNADTVNGTIDSVRIYNRVLTNDEINQTMNNTMVTSANVTHWHDAGAGYQTASFIVNMTTPTNTNYTVWYADNGSSFSQIGGTYTGNQTPSISGTKYQNTDVRIIMNGNSTATPEEMEITFVTETAGAAPVVTLVSQTPSTICQNCTGDISILYSISHSSAGLNNTSVSFIYRDYDHDLSDSNHSIRPPINDLASEWHFDGRILRGANRNESLNFENNATITGGDIYSWSGLDENNSEMSIVPVNSSYTKVYINSTIHRVMPQMHYIDRSELQEAPKTTIAIHKNQDVLVKFWNFEIFKGNTDFLGVGYTDTALNTNPALHPSDANPVNYYYISSGYDPSTGGDPLTSGYAVYMGSLNATGWVDHVYSPHANSSYVRGFINNTLLHSYINTTNISYVLYTSNTPSNKGYLINVIDVATSSNVSFANTSVLWAGDNAMSAEPYTPNIWFAFMKDNVSFDHKLYVADNNDLWGNSTINSTVVGEALFPPTKPSFYSFHNGDTDYDMNGTYSGTFDVQISAGSDPDGGDVVHNVSLYYGNKTYIDSIFNTSCNASCLYMNVSFDSTSYYSPTENYTFKVVATDDEGESVTTWLGVNFSLGLHVSGTVYGGDNIGLSDVSMTLGTYSTTTASDGTFLFTGISDGSHTLTSYIDGYDTLSKTVIVSGADVTGQDFYYDIIVDRGGGGGSGRFISIIEVLDADGEVIGKAIAIGKPGEAWFTIDLISVSRLLSGIDAKTTWSFIAILSIISILAGLFDTSKTTRPEFLLIFGFIGMGLYAIYQSKLAVVIGFG